MQLNKRPKGIILLIIIFILFVLRGVFYLSSNSLDFRLLNQYGLGWLHNVVSIVLIAGAIFLIYTFWKAKPVGYKIAFAFFGLNVVYTFVGFLLSLNNQNILIQHTLQKRLDRGLPTEGAEQFVNPGLLIASFIGYVIFYTILSWYIYKKRGYFTQKTTQEP